MRLGNAIVVALAVLGSLSGAARADTLYAAGGQGAAGRLYVLDPGTGAILLDVGALMTATGDLIGLTGLAVDPSTHVLYGSVINAPAAALRGHLVIVDKATAVVTDVGPFGTASTMADITFDPTTGVLHGWEADGNHQPAIIDKTTGVATSFGPISSEFGGGGLAASLSGVLYSTPDGASSATPHLDTVNKVTGVSTTGPTLSGAPLGLNLLNALDFSSAATLYGLNDGAAQSTPTHLVTIDTTTGAITDVGATPEGLDALAFDRVAAAVPGPTSLVLVGLGLASLARSCRRRERR